MTFIVDIITAVGLTIKAIVENIWNGIVGILSSVGSWIYNNVISPVINFFSDLWQKIKDGASQAWERNKISIFTSCGVF